MPRLSGQFWSPDGVSVAEDSGQRIEGREALQKQFATFFEEAPGARLTGQVTDIRIVRPDVAMVEGQTTLFVADSEPVVSAFSALLVRDGNEWLISNSHERDLPPPTSPQVALKDLEWLIGTWQDQSDDSQVITTVRWSPNQAFLIRSFTAQFADNELQGTQVIGWDPLNRQIRTWIFSSDGSFGQGTISKHDDDWMLKMWQILSDGRLAAATQVITRVDDNTMTVQVIGETVNGEPSADLRSRDRGSYGRRERGPHGWTCGRRRSEAMIRLRLWMAALVMIILAPDLSLAQGRGGGSRGGGGARAAEAEQRRLAQRRRCSAVGRFAISPQCFPARISAKHAEFGKLASEWEPPEHQSACHSP